MSAQSMSSSGGPANTSVSRTASTPKAVSCSPNRTPLPLDFDILAPWLITVPWFSCAENGSRKPTRPMSLQHHGEEPRVQQVQHGVLDAADVDVARTPRVDQVGCRTALGVVVRRAVAQEVPRRVDEGVHRVAVPLGRAAAGRAVDVDPVRGGGQRRDARGVRSAPRSSGSTTGSWSSGTGTSPHSGQCTIGIGAAPVALPATAASRAAGSSPRPARRPCLQPGDDRALGLRDVQPVQARSRRWRS